MLRNYLTVTLRNLWRNKLYTLINVIGLGIGLATMVWAWQNYRFSFSFDQIHKDRDQIYRINTFREGSEVMRGICPIPVPASARQDFASIEEFVRFDEQYISVKAVGSEAFFEQVQFVDPSFFTVFDFPMAAGSNDITDKSSIVITEAMAEKYFGVKPGEYASVLEKTISIFSGETFQKDLKVIGVIKNNRLNSSIWFNFLTHIDNEIEPKGDPVKTDNWRWFLNAAFVKLSDPSAATRLAEDFQKYIGPQNTAREDYKITGFYLEPLSQVANHEDDIWSNSLQERPPNSATYGPLVLAILIFLVCCLNFTNTTVARSNRRLKEMGVRKVMGSTQRQLVIQILLECSFIVLLSVFLAFEINEYWLPAYNQMWPYLDLEANYLSDTNLQLFILSLVVVTTLLAGSYPAFYISRFNPSNIFRGSVRFGGSNLFSRILLGLQVVISLMTVISSVAFSNNSKFQKNYDYGYDMSNVLFSSVRGDESFKAYQDAVTQLPEVEMTAGTRHHIGYSWRGVTLESEGQKLESGFMEVGDNYLEVMDLEVIGGRTFDPNLQTDYEEAMLVNEELLTQMGWQASEALGRKIRIDTINFTVVGLLKNFHQNNLFSTIDPMAIRLLKPEAYTTLIVRASDGKLNTVLDQMKATWERLFPFKPFDGYFQSEMTAESQLVTDNIAGIFSWFAIISVLLTTIGLFALVSLTVLKKMKEIAVRKVVGAAPHHIMYLVNKGYLWIFLVAAVIGCYGGWYLTKLLMDMIFRINVGVETNTLVVSSAAIFIIAGLTVSIKVWQAIRTNPADVLKSE